MKTQSKTAGILANTGIILFIGLNLLPLLIVLSSSLRDPSDMRSPLALFTQMSLKSYIIAFDRMHFVKALANSIFVTGISVAAVVVTASMAAYPIARMKSKTSKFLMFFFLAGLIVPGQLAITQIFIMLKNFHLTGGYLPPIIMFVTSSTCFSTFLYSGFISSSVPMVLEEAAAIDGCGQLRRFWRIVFPLIQPANIAVIIIMGVWIWNDFFFPMLFISKASQNTLPLAMLSFMGDSKNPTQWNILFAASFLCALPLLLVFSILQKYFIDGLALGGVKG